MEEKLLGYLEDFMIDNNWDDEHVPEQARAFFTTICFVGHLDADTMCVDRMLNDLYFRAALEEIIEYEAFESFMMELIV